LLLIHWPVPYYDTVEPCAVGETNFKKCRQDSWRAMEQIFRAGKARAIGVSNFEIPHLQDIFEMGSLIPSVNQVEYHPYWHEDELVEFCKAHKILFNSYSSVGVPDHMSDAWKTQVIEQPVVLNIAKKYNKSPAQVVLRWSWQQGIVVNARSWNVAHQIENLNIFDFELTGEEMSAIRMLPKPPNPKVCADPRNKY